MAGITPPVAAKAAAPAAAPSTVPRSRAASKSGPSEPPANGGARVGRGLDNLGRGAAKAPVVRGSQRAAVSAGSVIIGMVAYAIGVNYLQHGWPGVTAWLKAKLMNKTSQAGNGVQPAMYFHTGPGAGSAAVAAGPIAAGSPPAHPAAPTPSGGTLYA